LCGKKVGTMASTRVETLQFTVFWGNLFGK